MLRRAFLAEFKRSTEARWSERSIEPGLYGFQFQRGTRWNPGLPDDKIAEYEADLGLRFPMDLKAFLREMNGTDMPTRNVYGSSGEPQRESVGVYSYPRDLELVKRQIEAWRGCRVELTATLARENFDLGSQAGLVPIYAHRCVVCGTDPESSVVLSILDGSDAIVYANSLEEYLRLEFLR